MSTALAPAPTRIGVTLPAVLATTLLVTLNTAIVNVALTAAWLAAPDARTVEAGRKPDRHRGCERVFAGGARPPAGDVTHEHTAAFTSRLRPVVHHVAERTRA